jgi:hypothetical protein
MPAAWSCNVCVGPVSVIAPGVPERHVKGDLDRFEGFIESQGEAGGGWRGEIHGDRVESGGGGSSR